LGLGFLLVFLAGSVDGRGVSILGVLDAEERFEGIEDLIQLARRTRNPRTEFGPGKALSQVRNAHATNTKEQMRAALEHGYDFLEGDVREEINRPGEVEMRHDVIHESGDNLTLAEWLRIGRESGRGLKLDIKEPDHMPRVLRVVQSSGVGGSRLMFNLGASAMAAWGTRIRAAHPESWLALNPSGEDGLLGESEIATFMSQARMFGGSCTFVVRFDRLTPPIIARLETQAPVSVWNALGGPGISDPVAEAARIRQEGVTGVVDLRPTPGWGSKLTKAADLAVNGLRTGVDRGRNRLGQVAGGVARGFVNGLGGAGKTVGKLFGL